MDNQNKFRVTGCIKDRFAVMFDTDTEGTAEQRENFAHNAALALDFIGAGRIAKGEAYDLMLRVLNNEFKDEAELLEYISHIRAQRKPRQTSEATKAKNTTKMLLKRGYTTSDIAKFVNLDEAVVIEIARELNKEKIEETAE